MRINNFDDLRLSGDKDAKKLLQIHYAMERHFVLKNDGISAICNLPEASKKSILKDFDNTIATIQYLRNKITAYKKAINEKGTSFPMDIDLPEIPPQNSSNQSNLGCSQVVTLVISIIVPI